MQLPKLKAASKKSNKKKILLLSDDMRLKSGVGTVSREMILGTAYKYDWIQMGGALKHPDEGKGWIDMSKEVNKLKGISDSQVKIFPVAGYGNPAILRGILKEEKPGLL